jgi:hypothetical protein
MREKGILGPYYVRIEVQARKVVSIGVGITRT